MSRADPYPALAAWRRRDGNKPASQWTYDDLWRAAMSEMSAKEAAALGQHDAWKHHMEQARQALMLEAA